MNQYIYRRRAGDSGAIPNVIFMLLVANGLLFALQQFPPYYLEYFFSLWPIGAVRGDFYPWQILSYGFLHGSVAHLVFNMLMLWMFGVPVAREMGEGGFLRLYLLAGVFAGLCSLGFYGATGNPAVVVGASGAVYGLLVAFARFFPEQQLLMNEVFEQLARSPQARVLITGHADSTGDPRSNLALSERRALAVREHLLRRGVAPERLFVNHYGSGRGTGEGGRRRVEVEWLQ